MRNSNPKPPPRPFAGVTLKALAERLGLTPSTVSAVLNNSPAARAFPQRTKDRILTAAREMDYRPNFLARALRVKRTHTIGVITEEIGDAYGGMIISGIEKYLQQRGYFFLTVAHRHNPRLLDHYSQLLVQRGVEGFIAVDTSIRRPLPLPAVAVAGHRRVKGVTNLVLNHRTAARLALEHLKSLGHDQIALMKGPASSSDSEVRWQAILEACRKLSIPVRPDLAIHLSGDTATPDLAFPFAQRMLAQRGTYTALFAYNDNCAIACIRAIHEAGLRVPQDISVVGFDDIQSAAYCIPGLTTVRQPLREMGELAARTLLDRIEDGAPCLPEIAVEPGFIVRQSTATPRGRISEPGEGPAFMETNGQR